MKYLKQSLGNFANFSCYSFPLQPTWSFVNMQSAKKKAADPNKAFLDYEDWYFISTIFLNQVLLCKRKIPFISQ